MSMANWQVQGTEFAACNCNWGCPCQFNSLPSQGKCEAVVSMRVEHGHFKISEMYESLRPRLTLPNGFEFTEAEMASSSYQTHGAIQINATQSHGHFARLHFTGQGVVR